MNNIIKVAFVAAIALFAGYNVYSSQKAVEMIPMNYEHPKILKKRFVFAASKEHNLYVEAHRYSDLLTICDLYGNLVTNIYGPDWNDNQTNKTAYYSKPIFYKDKIIVSYSGKDSFTKDKGGMPRAVLSTMFQVFDIEGNYIKTLDVGYDIQDFCCDEKSNRLIMILDDDIQFGYLNLDGII